jgi:hypothetical protein
MTSTKASGATPSSGQNQGLLYRRGTVRDEIPSPPWMSRMSRGITFSRLSPPWPAILLGSPLTVMSIGRERATSYLPLRGSKNGTCTAGMVSAPPCSGVVQ